MENNILMNPSKSLKIHYEDYTFIDENNFDIWTEEDDLYKYYFNIMWWCYCWDDEKYSLLKLILSVLNNRYILIKNKWNLIDLESFNYDDESINWTWVEILMHWMDWLWIIEHWSSTWWWLFTDFWYELYINIIVNPLEEQNRIYSK